ncbi:MAG: AAA family ATPase, partial [Terrisporobacter sp.]
MAYVGEMEKVQKDKFKRHEEVRSTYSIFQEDGEKILQIDTYGSSRRERKDKVSQTIQVELSRVKSICEKEKCYYDKENPKKTKKDTILNVEDVILNIKRYMNSKGFYYKEQEIKNFYLSLKSKPFVILAGISGTGKSKLVELFAEAIGAKEYYSIIPVKPDWTDSTELLGYKDINSQFTLGVLSTIIVKAKENMDKPYFICIDEMNLARVEYYLGEYLSLVESRYRNKEGEIVTKEIFEKDYFSDTNICNELYFPQNLYIIGTVNMDDTTFGFSKKVLDRVNTIEFSDVDLSDLSFLEINVDEEISIQDCNNDFMKTNFLGLKEIWKSNLYTENLKEYVKEINNKVVEIHGVLKVYSRHFAFRVRDEIIIYMVENKLYNLFD